MSSTRAIRSSRPAFCSDEEGGELSRSVPIQRRLAISPSTLRWQSWHSPTCVSTMPARSLLTRPRSRSLSSAASGQSGWVDMRVRLAYQGNQVVQFRVQVGEDAQLGFVDGGHRQAEFGGHGGGRPTFHDMTPERLPRRFLEIAPQRGNDATEQVLAELGFLE